jgi:hypothetical protein
MRYVVARFLQLLGLILLPVGIAGNVARPEIIGLKESLYISGAGMGVFFLGWLLQRSSNKAG